MCNPAPGLLPDAARARANGARHIWIIGDASHTYGGHLCNPPRYNPSATDYTEVGWLNAPAALPRTAVAMDVTDEWPALHDYVADIFNRCRRGDQPDTLFEFIGRPSGGSRVLYWNANKGRRVELYTGSGHDRWFHAMIGRRYAKRDGLLLAGWGRYGKIRPGGLVAKLRARIAAEHQQDPSKPTGFPLVRKNNPKVLFTRDATVVPAGLLLREYGTVNPASKRLSVRRGTINNELVRYIEALTLTTTEAHDSYFGAGLQAIVKGLQANAGIPVHGEVDERTLVQAFGQPERWG
jgi:hypothetical protein